jgi:hypothetical protein
METKIEAIIRWDSLKDDEYPNGCFYCTIYDEDENNTYDKYLGNTAREAFDKWYAAVVEGK